MWIGNSHGVVMRLSFMYGINVFGSLFMSQLRSNLSRVQYKGRVQIVVLTWVNFRSTWAHNEGLCKRGVSNKKVLSIDTFPHPRKLCNSDWPFVYIKVNWIQKVNMVYMLGCVTKRGIAIYVMSIPRRWENVTCQAEVIMMSSIYDDCIV